MYGAVTVLEPMFRQERSRRPDDRAQPTGSGSMEEVS